MYNIVVGVAGAAIGWVLKIVWDSVKSLQADIKDIEREIHTGYVHKDDYRADILEVKDILNKIFDKLEKKADK